MGGGGFTKDDVSPTYLKIFGSAQKKIATQEARKFLSQIYDGTSSSHVTESVSKKSY